MSTPTMDDAARVLADPTAYADEPRLHAALTHLRANVPVAWVDNPPYPAILGDHQTRRHHGGRAGQRAVPQRAAAAVVDRRGGRRAQGRSKRPELECGR